MVSENVRINGVLVQRMNEETHSGVVTQDVAFRINRNFCVVATCHCGAVFVVQRNALRNGHATSCGCNRNRILRDRATKHGECADRCVTTEYQTWQAIKARCYMESSINYENYGGRGIVMCCGWRESPQSFLVDMGRKPSERHSIDRKDNNGHYSCGQCEECVTQGWTANCRWATPMEQGNNTSRNRMLTFYGKTMSLSDWARVAQINPVTVRNRMARGKTDKDAMWTPVIELEHNTAGHFCLPLT